MNNGTQPDPPSKPDHRPVNAPLPMTRALLGNLDRVTRDSLEGWAHDPSSPDQPVELDLLHNDIAVLRFCARTYRADLKEAGFADGCCAFSVHVSGGWPTAVGHELRVRRACDGVELQGSPVTLEPTELLSQTLRQDLAAALKASACCGTEGDTVLHSLVRQADTLLRARVAIDGTPPGFDLSGFYARWGTLLPDSRAPVPRRMAERPLAVQRRALIVAETLHNVMTAPVRDHLASLRRLKHEVTIAVSNFTAFGSDEEFQLQLRNEGFLVQAPPLSASVEETLRRHANLFDVVMIYQIANVLAYGELIRRYSPQARIVLCIGDLLSTHVAQRAVAEQSQELGVQAGRLRTQETIATWSVDAVLVRSEAIAATLRAVVPVADVRIVAEGDDLALDACLKRALRLG